MSSHFLRSLALSVAATSLISIPCLASNTQHKNQVQGIRLISARAKLETPLSSNKDRQGQKVMAKLTGDVKNMGSTELPDGTILLGHVRQVQASHNGSPAKIGVVFNQARLKSGREVPIKATLTGAYPPVILNSGNNGSYSTVEPHYISAKSSFLQEPGALSHVTMRSAVRSGTSGVFMSKSHNVDLRPGTRLELGIAVKKSAGMGQAGM